MTWHAKPKGAYDYSYGDGNDNLWEMVSGMSGWSDAAKAGAIGNSVHEGGMNPWRWQGDKQSSVSSGGYGLFQYTPGSGYTNLSGAHPNLNVNATDPSEYTPGAVASDGAYQVSVMVNNTLSKWVSSCWRSYWSTTTYADLYAYRQQLLNTYGDGSSISMSQYSSIVDDVEACCFIFLACFEGPAVPNYATRKYTCNDVYRIITGQEPPTPPTPPGPSPADLPAWLIGMFKKKKNRKKIQGRF